MPKKLHDNVMKQEKNLERIKTETEMQEKMSTFLQKMTQKKKKDLLIFSGVDKRMKNEVNELIQSTQSGISSTTNNWYVVEI